MVTVVEIESGRVRKVVVVVEAVAREREVLENVDDDDGGSGWRVWCCELERDREVMFGDSVCKR